MKYTVKKIMEESRVEIKFTFTQEEYDEVYEQELAKEMAKAELKGFRKGKVPRTMFLKHFGDYKVHNNTMNELINESYREAIEEKKIDVVEMADIELIENMKKGFGYIAKVHVFPECTAKDYLGIEVTKEEVKVTDEDVEAEVKRNLGLHAEMEVVEGGTLEKGMTAVFDFKGFTDGKEFEGGSAENYELEIGSGQFIPGFEDQMVGMKENEEKTIKVTFPENYAEKLAGKDAEFKITLHEIKQKVLPELNDEFVTELNIDDVKTVSDYKKYLYDRLLSERTEASDNKYLDDALKIVLDNNPICIPDGLVESEVNRKVKSLENQAKSYGIPAEMLLKYQGVESMDQYKELIKPGIKDEIHYDVVVAQIAKQEKLKLTKEDYDKYYEKLAKGERLTVKDAKAKYSKDVVKHYFLLQKAQDLILDSIKK